MTVPPWAKFIMYDITTPLNIDRTRQDQCFFLKSLPNVPTLLTHLLDFDQMT